VALRALGKRVSAGVCAELCQRFASDRRAAGEVVACVGGEVYSECGEEVLGSCFHLLDGSIFVYVFKFLDVFEFR
jgi:hypothetical protein